MRVAHRFTTPRSMSLHQDGSLQLLRLFLTHIWRGCACRQLCPCLPLSFRFLGWMGMSLQYSHVLIWLLLGLCFKWSPCCYLCVCVCVHCLRGGPQRPGMSVLSFVGNWACHLWVLLLCFLVCFDVFGALYFGNYLLEGCWLAYNENSKERRQLMHKGFSCPGWETRSPWWFLSLDSSSIATYA